MELVEPSAGPARRTLSAAALKSVSDRDHAVESVRSWPGRTVLMVGGPFSPLVTDLFDRRGFAPVFSRADVAEHLATTAGPFSFLAVDLATCRDRANRGLIARLLQHSPSARVVMIARPAELDSAVLIEAMRAGVHDVIDPLDRSMLELVIEQQLRLAGQRRERVLAIGAHPDDIEIGCAGTLLGHRRRGDRLSLLTLSRGAVGGDFRQRRNESAAAADALGAELLLGDLPDTEIDAGIDTIKLIEEVIQRVAPTVIYVHSAHDTHQDHRAVHAATVSAGRGVPEMFAYQSPSASDEFRPHKFVAIDELMPRKLELLDLFASQSERSYLEPDYVTAGARYWARHLSRHARYAEPFEVVRSVRQSIEDLWQDTELSLAQRRQQIYLVPSDAGAR